MRAMVDCVENFKHMVFRYDSSSARDEIAVSDSRPERSACALLRVRQKHTHVFVYVSRKWRDVVATARE